MYKVIDVTLTPDTSIFANGDVIADTQVIVGACPMYGSKLQSLVLVDKDDQKAAVDIYFLSDSGTMGTENSAPSISDANGATILAMVPVATADYKDLGGVSIAMYSGLQRILAPVVGSSSVYVAVVNGSGTPTYTASGLVLRLGLEF